MVATNKILLTIVAAGANSLANAADLPPPPPAPPIPLSVPAPAFGGWYLRGDVGVGAVQGSNFQSTIEPGYANGAFVLPNGPIVPAYAAIGDSALYDFGFGYQFNNWLRGDLTGEYRTEATYRRGISAAWWTPGGVGTNFDVYSAGLSTALFIANGYVDIGSWRGLTPYAHAGVGLAAHNFQGLNDNGGAVAVDAHPTNLAWSVGAGLAVSITPNFKIDVSYRYIDMGGIASNRLDYCLNQPCFNERQSFHAASNDIRLGFRYVFVEPVAAAPVIAKY